ncbi:MAG: glycine--tRNA ligase [Patescibacteria group bacterium]
MTEPKDKMEKIISLAKRRGFIYQGSEIYGGLSGTWDYGPLGVLLKENIKALWLKMFRDSLDNIYPIDASILMSPKVWEASGHVAGFADPMVECQNRNCKDKRHRVDHLLPPDIYKEILNRLNNPSVVDRLNARVSTEVAGEMPQNSKEEFSGQGDFLTRKAIEEKIGEFETRRTGVIMQSALMENKIKCPSCGHVNWGVPKQFNMMFKTFIGAAEDEASISYLRPETAQGIFTNFKNVIDSFHPKMPFGMAQVGKAFRNEISPRDFLFRVREMEQMEVEYFVKEKDWEEAFDFWREKMNTFAQALGIFDYIEHEISKEELAHYSKRTIDFEFNYPFGQKELWGLAYRTDHDLKSHNASSGVDLQYFDEESGERFTPHVIEPSLGVDRTVLATLLSAYKENELGGEARVCLKLPKNIAPVRAAVFPLLKNKPELVSKAREVYTELKKNFPNIEFDDNGNIGKRYRRQDEIGTPFCITIDFDTLGDPSTSSGQGTPELKNTVTVRDRDTGEQKRVKIEDLKEAIR